MNMAEKLLTVLIITGLAVYALDFLVIQNTNFFDAATYIRQTRATLQGQGLSQKAKAYPIQTMVLLTALALPIPLIYAIKAVPLLLFAMNASLAFLIAKNLFPKRWRMALALTACNYWIIVFSTVNYAEPFLLLYLQTFFYLFIKEYRARETSMKRFAAMAGVVLLGVATKLTGFFFVPLLFVALVVLFLKKKGVRLSSQVVFAGAILLVAGSCAVFLTENPISFRTSALVRVMVTPQFVREHRPLEQGIQLYSHQLYRLPLEFYRFPPNDCLNQLVFREWLPVAKGVFIALVSVVTLVALFGGILALKSNLVWKTLVLTTALGTMSVALDVIQASSFILPRYAMPIMAFIGLLFAKGYKNLEKKSLKRLAMACMAVLCIYTLSYTAYLGTYYNKVNSRVAPGMDYIEGLPSTTTTCGSHFTAAVLGDYINANVVPCNQTSYATHVWVSCYSETIPLEKMHELDVNGFVELVWADECNTVFRVLDQSIFWKPEPLSPGETGGIVSPIEGTQELWLPGIASTKASEPNFSGKRIDACH